MGNTPEACKFCVVVVVVVAVDDHDEEEDDGENDEENEEEEDDDDDDDKNDVDAKTEQHNLEDHCSGSLTTSPTHLFQAQQKSVGRIRDIQDTETTRGKDHTHWLLQEAKLQKKHAVNGPSRFFLVAQLCSTISFWYPFFNFGGVDGCYV